MEEEKVFVNKEVKFVKFRDRYFHCRILNIYRKRSGHVLGHLRRLSRFRRDAQREKEPDSEIFQTEDQMNHAKIN